MTQLDFGDDDARCDWVGDETVRLAPPFASGVVGKDNPRPSAERFSKAIFEIRTRARLIDQALTFPAPPRGPA